MKPSKRLLWLLVLFGVSVGASADDCHCLPQCLPQPFIDAMWHQGLCGVGKAPDCPPPCPGTVPDREKPYFERFQ
ncbi:MAG: hypothetical protein PHU14_08150 [Methylovulum sp.]|nr:hypothetical protein [Methylovulum sp.]